MMEIRYIFRDVRRHKARTALNITGYAVAGIFFLILLSISGKGKEDSLGILRNTGTHLILYIPTDENCCSGAAGGYVYADGVKTMMLDNNILYTVRKTEGVRDAAPYLLYRMYNESFRSDISIGGIDTSSIATISNVCARTNLISGRYFSGNPDEVVAEESFAMAHGIKAGDTLSIFGYKNVVSGIINSGIKPAKADFYAPIENVRVLLRDSLKCTAPYFDMNIILVEVADARFQDEVIKRLGGLMNQFSISSYNCYEPAYRVMAIIEKSSMSFAIALFLFLVIFSARSQLSDLTERFRETGILKSLGWSDYKLSSDIIVISLIQSLIGVTIGLLAGFILITILKNYDLPVFRIIDIQPRLSNIPALYGFSAAGALIADIFPVYRIFSTRAGEIINNYQ